MGNRMTGDVLLRGNRYFREERNKWRIRTMLRSILRYAGVDIDSLLDGENVKPVFSEVVLFSTPRAVGIETVVRRHDCHKRCEALIEILQPKRILCLGAQKMVPASVYREPARVDPFGVAAWDDWREPHPPYSAFLTPANRDFHRTKWR